MGSYRGLWRQHLFNFRQFRVWVIVAVWFFIAYEFSSFHTDSGLGCARIHSRVQTREPLCSASLPRFHSTYGLGCRLTGVSPPILHRDPVSVRWERGRAGAHCLASFHYFPTIPRPNRS